MTPSLDEVQRRIGAGTHILRDLEFVSASTFDATATLTPRVATPGGSTVALRAVGVRNLEVQAGPYLRVQLAGLFVTDVTQDQWESVRYRVESEDDNGTYLSFLCAELEARAES